MFPSSLAQNNNPLPWTYLFQVSFDATIFHVFRGYGKKPALREKYPNTEFFLVRIQYSVRIQENTG